MNIDDVRIVQYHSNLSKRFGFWITLHDRRRQRNSVGKKGKKSLIQYFESFLGPLGSRWQYSNTKNNFLIVKLDKEADLILFLLKFKKN